MKTKTQDQQPERAGIYAKLLDFQKKVKAIKKDAVNPHFRSKYATLPVVLSEVKPILSELGLVILQPVNESRLFTKVIDTDTGEEISTDFLLPSTLSPQQFGSAMTYYRRYLLASLLSLEIDDEEADDDGNKAQVAPKLSAEQRVRVARNRDELKAAWSTLTDKEKETFKELVESLSKTYELQTA